jgi:hypothetical protein
MDLPIWFPLDRELLAEASALIGKPSKSEWIRETPTLPTTSITILPVTQLVLSLMTK